jgi:hypothetical protein
MRLIVLSILSLSSGLCDDCSRHFIGLYNLSIKAASFMTRKTSALESDLVKHKLANTMYTTIIYNSPQLLFVLALVASSYFYTRRRITLLTANLMGQEISLMRSPTDHRDGYLELDEDELLISPRDPTAREMDVFCAGAPPGLLRRERDTRSVNDEGVKYIQPVPN